MKKGNDSKGKNAPNGSGLNFEAQLWAAADKMRGHMDASEYKHVTQGLIPFNQSSAKSNDMLGHVYGYSPGELASAEGKGGGEFCTPQCVVQVLVAMLEPDSGHGFDPCCGSGGMFVQSESFVEEHGGRVDEIAVYGQESSYATWNLALRSIEVEHCPEHAKTFHRDLHPVLCGNSSLANPTKYAVRGTTANRPS